MNEFIMSAFDTVSRKFRENSATIGVVGLGYVGLPMVESFARLGYQIIGVDLDEWKIDQLKIGRSYIQDVESSDIAYHVDSGRFKATSAYAPLADADAILICVPTPFDAMKAPVLEFIKSASSSVAEILRPGQLIVLQSTTYPGTTEEIVLPLLEKSGLKVGQEFFLAFSPERIDPGHTSSPGFTVENTPKVVGGVTDACSKLAANLLSQMTADVHVVSSPRTAEMTKLLENTFRSVNIALVNELTVLSERMGIDIWEVIDAAKTKPFGFMPFYPGPGVGGHCIPVDPFYLSWKAREYDYYTKFIELAAEVNSDMPHHAVYRINQALNFENKSMLGAKILVLGVAFKPDVEDARNSPAERVIELLLESGADVSYCDPYIPSFTAGNNTFLKEQVRLVSEELTAEKLRLADCVAVITGHSIFDYDWISEHSQVIVDTVNATKSVCGKKAKIFRLGASFDPIH